MNQNLLSGAALAISLAALAKQPDRSGDAPGSGAAANNVGYASVDLSAFDGTSADAAPTINAAVAAAAMLGYRTLMLPAGTYRIASTVHLNRGDVRTSAGTRVLYGMRLMGAGSSTTRLIVSPGTVALWWHTMDVLSDEAACVQPTFMREFGGGGFTILGRDIDDGSVAIRIGGRRVVAGDVMENKYFHDVFIDNIESAWQDDDSTNTHLSMFSLGRFKYGFEHGYNCDTFFHESGYIGHEDAFLWDVPASGVVGSSVVTFEDTLDDQGVRISSKLCRGWVVNAPGCAPHETYVGVLTPNANGTCSVTLQNWNGEAVALTAAPTTVSFFVGRVHVYGSSTYARGSGAYPNHSSPWTPPHWSQGKTATTQGRENGNRLRTGGAVCGGRYERYLDAGGPSHFDLTVDVYAERISHLAKLGCPGVDGSCPQSVRIVGNYINGHKYLSAPAVHVVGRNLASHFYMADNHCDTTFGDTSAHGVQPWFSCETWGSWRLVYERNYLPVGQGSQLRLYSADIGDVTNPLESSSVVRTATAVNGNAVQTRPAVVNWDYVGQDTIVVNLTGANGLVNNPGFEQSGVSGRLLTIVLVQTEAGRTTSFGNRFLSDDGSAMPTLSAGPVGKRCSVEFVARRSSAGVVYFVVRSVSPWY